MAYHAAPRPLEPVVATLLLAVSGEQRERFESANRMQSYARVAPVTERSGNKCRVHWRLRCPKFLRQTFVEWAAHSMPYCYWAEAYYRQQRAKGASHQAALRAFAFKWIRIVYAAGRRARHMTRRLTLPSSSVAAPG